MTSMIERVARALARKTLTAKGQARFDAEPLYYAQNFSLEERRAHRSDALTAIEVIAAALKETP